MIKHTKVGRMINLLGIGAFALGMALRITRDTQDYSSFSLPLIIIGLVLIIATNFFKRKKDDDS
ncbi:hypothetical protein [Bacillus sp. PS06]|uniref:hypothetical protein n=1 Tax=Bacillus sp. PS06 TaxID=2764176 RepID=UPI0017818037|nr:hypothetical protein [Bacillus sp. PS06]MBD8070028.1 hypothetical protein [Bacillus sp. PS06]